MKTKIGLILIAGLFFQNSILAETTAREKAIGLLFKNLAKGFIVMSDIEKFKADSIEELREMNDEKFRKKYGDAYKFIKDFPSEFKDTYGFSEQITKKQLIGIIESLDKKKLFEMIGSIPDEAIASFFQESFEKKKKENPDLNALDHVKDSWGEIKKEIE